MLNNYVKIKKLNASSNINDQLYSKLLSHPISIFIVALVEKSFITPNMLTFISFIFSLSGAYFIIYNSQAAGLLYAWICLHFALVFDSADGQLARWKNLKSSFGAYLDVFTDQVQHRLVTIALTIRIAELNDNAFLIGITVLAIETLASHENVLQKNIKLQEDSNLIQSRRNETADKVFGKSKLRKLLANFQKYLFADYIYLAICFILNEPLVFLYIKGGLALTWTAKRFFIFYMMSRKAL